MKCFGINPAKYLALILITLSILPPGARAAAGGHENSNRKNSDAAAPKSVPSAGEYGNFPLLFESNAGQADRRVKFITRGRGYQLFLTGDGASYQLQHADGKSSDVLKINFAGAGGRALVEGLDASVTKTNYYAGKKRFENISNYEKVRYREIYHGIDAVFYGGRAGLEYDFIVSPGADAARIALDIDGARGAEITAAGDLRIMTANTEMTQKKPYAYQLIDGARTEIAAGYRLDGDKVTFELGEYDRALPLVIDPVVKYLTYIGGTEFDTVRDIKADAAGSAYIVGETKSLDFHGEARPLSNNTGVFAAKINAAGTAFEYITILEGLGTDLGTGNAIDADGNAYLTGHATRDFPATSGAYDDNLGGPSDAYAAKIGATGNLIYSTYIGGTSFNDIAFDIAVDAAGRAYVTGGTQSGTSFPRKNQYSGCGFTTLGSSDAYLTVINGAGSDVVYSTCIGGFQTEDKAHAVAVDADNNAYITGIAEGENFPVKNGFQTENGGGTDAFVAKINTASSGEASLVYSTYLGGSGTDDPSGIAVDQSGRAHVVGVTGSFNYPLKNALRSTNQVNEAFVTVLAANGASLLNSTFLGGADQDFARDVTVTAGGIIYVSGLTRSGDFPLAQPVQGARAGAQDAFVTKMKFGGAGIMFSTFLGGADNDEGSSVAVQGARIFVGGLTESNDLPVTAGAIKTASNASAQAEDGFVTRILDTQFDSVGAFTPASAFRLTQSITNIVSQPVTNAAALAGERGVSGDWNGDDVDSIGSFSSGIWKVRDQNFLSTPPKVISFGQAGDLPMAGDWNGDGIDTPGVFRPGTGQFLLTNSTLTTPPVELAITFGLSGDLPIAGDWNGDGIDSVGVFRPSGATFFLTDENVPAPPISLVAFFGVAEDLPVAGDFDANGIDTIGVWRPSSRQFFLSNDNVNIAAAFNFGGAGAQPIIGDWDGKP